MSLLSGALGAVTGGLLGGMANQKEGGQSAGNIFNLGPAEQQRMLELMKSSAVSQTPYTGDPTKELQSNEVLGKLFGEGGTLGRTADEEQRLANQGFELTPEDRTAYGQASGDISRLYGEQENSLAQALSNRGLSSSGAAGAAFTGLQGNKMEQLAKAQQGIAKQRFQSNLERLGQTRNFLSNLGQQGAQGINDMQQLGHQKAEDANQANMNKFNMANSLLGNMQGQMNKGFQQERDTEHSSNLSNIISGGVGGAMQGAQMDGGLGGGNATKMAGQSYSKGGVFA